MRAVLVPSAPVDFEALEALAHSLALPLRWAPPETAGTQTVALGDGERWLRLISLMPQGTQLLLVDEALVPSLQERLETREAGALLAEPSDDPLEIARKVALAAAVLQSGVRDGETGRLAREVLLDRLLSADPLLRRLAGRLCWTLADEEGLAAVRRAAERWPDLGFAVEALASQVQQTREGTLHDRPTSDPMVLEDRAMEAVSLGQPERARKAAQALLQDQPWNQRGIYALGVALSEVNPLCAIFLLGAASERTETPEAALADAPERIARLQERLQREPATEAQQQEARALVLEKVSTWRGSASHELVLGGARALLGLLPELQPLLLHLVGEGDRDLARLEQAAQMAPGVPYLTWRWLQILHKTEPERAEALMDALAERLRQGVPHSPLEAEMAAALQEEPITLASVLTHQAKLAYEAQRYERAIALADQALEQDPGASTAHQVRALSFTFSGRLQEALSAYTDAIAALDAELSDPDGLVLSDPRAGQWFNRACCHAKLGHREPALEDLRRAVQLDPKYAEQAATDDWFSALWSDPDFQAIVAREPDALVLAEHRTAEHALSLLTRAMDAENAGDRTSAIQLAEQAAQAARLCGAVAVQAEALGQQARALALQGHLDQAALIAEQAASLASDPSLPAALRGAVLAQVGVVSQARGDWAGARRAFEQSLEARREAGDRLLVARSEITLSMLELLEGGPDRARERAERALAVLQEASSAEHAPASVFDDLALAWLRLAEAQRALGALPEALSALDQAVGTLERVAAQRVAPLAGVVQAALQCAIDLQALGVGQALAIHSRASALLSSGHPDVDRVRDTFRALRLAVAQWRSAGVEDATLASWIREAALQRPLPSEAQHPALLALGPLYREVCARQDTLLVTGAMAIELLAAGSFDRALGDLEELWASAMAASS